MDDAIPIQFTNPIAKAISETGKPEELKQNVRDGEIETLSNMPGWKNLKKLIEAKIKGYENFNVSPTDDPEMVGVKYLTSRQIIAELNSIILKVEATAENVRKRREGTENGN